MDSISTHRLPVLSDKLIRCATCLGATQGLVVPGEQAGGRREHRDGHVHTVHLQLHPFPLGNLENIKVGPSKRIMAGKKM